jgi:hypothetical protein
VLTLLAPDAALAAWDDIARAVKRIKGIEPAEIHDRLGVGTLQAWRVSGRGVGWVLTSVQTTSDTQVRGLWVCLAAGEGFGRQAMVGVERALESVAKAWGCAEMRAEVERLGFLKVLPGWVHHGEISGRFALKKVL